MHHVPAIQPGSDNQSDADERGEKTPFETRQWICPEPLPHRSSLEFDWIDSLFNHGHPLFVSVVEVYDQNNGGAAEEEDRNQEFAVHKTSCVHVLELTFVWAFGIFDLTYEQKVTVGIPTLCNPRLGFVV
jgi:hypothetical protein